MAEFIVRPFQAKDRHALLRIGADTAFFGAPIEAYMEDRNIFLDAFYVYYTDLEPEHAWVACADEAVVGFLTGCVDTRAQAGKIRRLIVPQLIGKLLRGGYHFGRHSLAYIVGITVGELRREEVDVDEQVYPAHLHINLDSAWRGHGLGQRLMEAYLGQLRGLGVPGVHLGTTNLNEAACRLYEKMGFRLLGSHRSSFWSKWCGRTVENRAYGLKLFDESLQV